MAVCFCCYIKKVMIKQLANLATETWKMLLVFLNWLVEMAYWNTANIALENSVIYINVKSC